jgi:hypothetical protein
MAIWASFRKTRPFLKLATKDQEQRKPMIGEGWITVNDFQFAKLTANSLFVSLARSQNQSRRRVVSDV